MPLMMSPRLPSSRRTGSVRLEMVQRPTSTSGGEPHALEVTCPLDQKRPVLPHRVEHVPAGAQVGELIATLLLGDQHAVEPGEAFGVDLPLQAARHLLLGLAAQLQRDELGRPLADTVGDVVAGDVERLAVAGDAPHEDVGVGMAGVVVIDRDPLEPGLQVGFHLPHQVAGGLLQVRTVPPFLGRYDEAELVAVVAAAVEEGATVRLITVAE